MDLLFDAGPQRWARFILINEYTIFEVMTSYIVIALFAIGIGIGWLMQSKERARKGIDTAVTWSVYLLLFLLGISVGTNDEIINNFSRIGYKAFWLTFGAVFGSILLAMLVYRFFFKTQNEK
ncbi:LysO family transporter [Carboxylicivirga marina]|uniref:LysO family transporter n=1 Tax=Carboxylicivirga marina TaxID=2800988 RepID=A0ABS1HMY7_9BACT|nr:LysO family transporter [Carboxylicivirga marina]MBK3519047.1 LysO family transporter [Carboxylicivirga marina]